VDLSLEDEKWKTDFRVKMEDEMLLIG